MLNSNPPITGPPHFVDLHVNPGESVSIQLFDGNETVLRGPATITMISQHTFPPIPLPVQVPPGHMIQQIVDENGTLRHIILSALNNNGGNSPSPCVGVMPQQQLPYCCCCCYSCSPPSLSLPPPPPPPPQVPQQVTHNILAFPNPAARRHTRLPSRAYSPAGKRNAPNFYNNNSLALGKGLPQQRSNKIAASAASADGVSKVTYTNSKLSPTAPDSNKLQLGDGHSNQKSLDCSSFNGCGKESPDQHHHHAQLPHHVKLAATADCSHLSDGDKLTVVNEIIHCDVLQANSVLSDQLDHHHQEVQHVKSLTRTASRECRDQQDTPALVESPSAEEDEEEAECFVADAPSLTDRCPEPVTRRRSHCESPVELEVSSCRSVSSSVECVSAVDDSRPSTCDERPKHCNTQPQVVDQHNNQTADERRDGTGEDDQDKQLEEETRRTDEAEETSSSRLPVEQKKSESVSGPLTTNDQRLEKSLTVESEASDDDDDDDGRQQQVLLLSSSSCPSSASSSPVDCGLRPARHEQLPRLQLLNLTYTSLTANTVKLKWQQTQPHANNSQQLFTQHYVVEMLFNQKQCASGSPDAASFGDSPRSSRVVYQGHSTNCRVSHLNCQQQYWFRVRTTVDRSLVVSNVLTITTPEQPLLPRTATGKSHNKKGAKTLQQQALSSGGQPQAVHQPTATSADHDECGQPRLSSDQRCAMLILAVFTLLALVMAALLQQLLAV